MSNSEEQQKIVIYTAPDGEVDLRVQMQDETIWATRMQMAKVFDVTPQNISIHLKGIFSDGELDMGSTSKESLLVQKEGGRDIKRKTKEYNLDVIIAVGYRINSAVGTNFRKWATKTLKQHVTKGYTINPQMIAKNYETFLSAVEDVKKLAGGNHAVKSEDILELVKAFAGTWFSLESYDEDKLPQRGFTKKDAHLLYFMVKNHPFTDGNKRTGAFSFVWFLSKAGVRYNDKITPEALTAITLLVAESDPKDKDRIIGLVLLMLKG